MTLPAIRFLDELIDDTCKIFEFGSGNSTIWLARRCGTLTSLESSPDWYARVKSLLAAEALHSCTLLLTPLDSFPAEISAYPDKSLDLVIVDSDERQRGERLRYIEASISKVKPGRYLLLDDSDRNEYRPADSLLSGWGVQRFVGMKPFPLQATETSIYRRPTDDTAVRTGGE
jgi:predicted O-methyltransferase YrrM